MTDKLPDWMQREAVVICETLGLYGDLDGEAGMVAAALLSAYRMGRADAGDEIEIVEQALKDWLHDYAPDLCNETDVAAARARIGANGTIAYIAQALAAIRKLGDTP